MQFYKKVLVLKQIESGFSLSDKPVSGICRVEVECGVAQLFITLINVAPQKVNDYEFVAVDGKGKTFFFNGGKHPSSLRFDFTLTPDIQNGFAIGLYTLSNDIPITVAFACEGLDFSLADFKKTIAERCLTLRKVKPKKENEQPQVDEPFSNPTPTKPPYPPAPQPDPNKNPPQEFPSPKSNEEEVLYDDEAVATTDYYAFDQQLDQRLNAVKEWNDERLRLEDEPTFNRRKEEENTRKSKDAFFEDETDFSFSQEYSQRNPYFATVKKDLTSVLEKFETQTGLENLFPDSRWAKINYLGDKYYVVGLIKENSVEKYICYGVPAKYSLTPPKELKGYCTFIPLSIFDLSGDGFWMMFQNAITGECIKPKPPFD